ncbi:MAG: glycosyltransferase [Bacteroidetes bacterium]|nr:MAG: glycosyltransferase [Bacteroidota bacterium]REJ99712.1 MAG: glycosyltransferase [Bacteroidota bacterium]REK32906.1 MAG: glycosyltransferase [Bacteroidota bacterium]REK47711.1 MAG: glycosyltransferase [Bacteroidota bacterium]
MHPRLTIAVPVHNEEKFIEQTLKSAITALSDEVCLVVSENASSDRSREIIKSICEGDNRIKLLLRDEKIPVIEHFRNLVQQCETEYFMWLGGHDILFADYPNQAISKLDSDESISLIYPDCLQLNENGKTEYGSSKLEDDLDTSGLQKLDALEKVANNTFSCFATYGIMRTKWAREIPFQQVIGFDHLLIFHMAVCGHIRHLAVPGLGIRAERKESNEQRTARYIKEGIIRSNERYSYERHAAKYFSYISKSVRLSMNQKFSIIKRLIRVFRNKFEVKPKGLVRYYFHALTGL